MVLCTQSVHTIPVHIDCIKTEAKIIYQYKNKCGWLSAMAGSPMIGHTRTNIY